MGQRTKQAFLQRRHTDGQQTQENILNITHYQRNANQTPMRYHFTSVRMAAIQKSTNNKCQRGCGEKGTLLHCLWECKLVQLLWRTAWRFLKKLKIELLPIPFLVIYLKKTLILKDKCATMFIATLFTITMTGKQPKCLLTKRTCGTNIQRNTIQKKE